jgi:hypothetical protein
MICAFSVRRSTCVIALLLALTVPILSTMARRGWYLSPSDHAHYLIDASKAKMPHAPVSHDGSPLRAVVVSVPLQPQIHIEPCLEPIASPFSYLLGVILSLQHRSPPILAA